MLTIRQRQILKLLGEGLTTEEIGNKIFITGRGVRYEIESMCERFDCKNRTGLVLFAYKNNLLSETIEDGRR